MRHEMPGCRYSPEAVFHEVEDIAAASNEEELREGVA